MTQSLAMNARALREPYPHLLERLSELSVCKYQDPYADIAWDTPEHRIEPEDPRHALDPEHPLAQSAWHERLDPRARAQFGLAWTVQQLKYGIALEASLSRGLLQFCQTLPDGSLEYRYAMHEVIEEARHSMMFQEFINRAGLRPEPLSWIEARLDDSMLPNARHLPTLPMRQLCEQHGMWRPRSWRRFGLCD